MKKRCAFNEERLCDDMCVAYRDVGWGSVCLRINSQYSIAKAIEHVSDSVNHVSDSLDKNF